MKDILNRIRNFRDDRDFKQFHTPENLAKSISIEAAELLELFQWSNDYDKEKACEEVSDVMIYCLFMMDAMNVNYKDIIIKKMKQNEAKYPIDKAKGNSKKYTEL